MFVDSTNNRVGIGTTSPQAGTGLHIKTGASGATPNGDLIIEDDANVKILLSCPAANTAQIHFGDDAANNVGKLEYIHSSNSMTFSTDATERMRITSGGDVGVGTTTPSSDISGTATVVEIADNNCASIALNNTGASTKFEIASLAADALTFRDNGTERMRVDNSGKLLIGKSVTTQNTAGTVISATDGVRATVDQNVAAILNRTTDDGNIALFRKDGTTVGSIANNSTNLKVNGVGALELSENGTTRVFVDGGGFFPFLDNTYDIGSSSLKFDDIFATNQTIQPSDQTMKQQIASLTEAEITAAKAISKLFKTFKWNDSVAAKGENARTHTGHIAQEVKSAMTDAGLDASKYAFFCSNTWWEHDVEVPAVEAVEAQDAVYDDDGNLVSEAVEAVEAREAYTRTDIYDTADEAPEGATEKTRLGIRYPELLAFIGAATEQRLTHLETLEARIVALENA